LSQFVEVKVIQLALDIADREGWPVLYLYADSWMVANALWGGYSSGRRTTGSAEANPSGLPHCGKILLPG